MLIPLLVGGWCAFGLTAAVPLALWWWQQRPQAGMAVVRIDLIRVREARLGRWRTRVLTDGAPPLEIFHDEIDPERLAFLRRSLIEVLSVRGGPQHVEPV